MKKAIVFGIALLVAGTSAYALTNGRDGSGGYGPIGDGYVDLRDVGDVLIYQCREANDGFSDMIPFYEAALTAAGAAVSSIDAPSGGGALPGDYSPAAYPVTFVVTGENWWGPNFPPGDEAIVEAYLNGGGALMFVGQDYLYGAGYPDGAAFGFPAVMGVGNILQDQPFGADFMDILGHDIFEGYYSFADALVCFIANPFYPDAIEPSAEAATSFEYVTPETHNAATIMDTGTYRVIFSGIEHACDTLGVFDGMIATAWEWLAAGNPVATEETTVGAVKASYK